MTPLNHSPQIELPPMRNGASEARAVPDTAVVRTRLPFTYSRKLPPDNVAAKCVHVFSGAGPVPAAIKNPPVAKTSPCGGPNTDPYNA